MSTFHAVDMREGNPVTQIIRFSIPMLIGNIAQQLYNTVDSIIVGRFVGDNALAAVGSAGPILNLMIVLFIGISVGASIMVSQYFGAQKREELSKAIGCCITLTGAASLLIMVIGPLTAGPLLRLLNTPESIIAWCEEYLTIIFLGVLGGGYYNILSGVMRGLGDSASALIFLLVATAVNIVLDYVFVAKLGMGVAGVAWATVIAQLVSAVLALVKILRMKDIFELRLRHLMPGGRYFRTLIRLGLPSGVTQAIFSMSMIVVQSLTNSFRLRDDAGLLPGHGDDDLCRTEYRGGQDGPRGGGCAKRHARGHGHFGGDHRADPAFRQGPDGRVHDHARAD